MVRLKEGVRLDGLEAQMVFVAFIVSVCYAAFDGGYDCVCTSGSDGKHKVGSKHYCGRALDFRTRHIPVDRLNALRKMIAEALGSAYRVILERTHMHIQAVG